MRELYFENQGTNTYLVYEIKEDDVVDSMSLGMITNNKIAGLVQTLYTQMDNSRFIKFNVSAKLSVAQFFSGVVNKKRLLGVFKGIVDGMLSAEEYMIEANTILLDMNYIFTDVSTCDTVLVCLPVITEESAPVDMGTFFKNIVFTTQFDQTENCEHVAKIINYLNGASTFTLTDFKKVLDDIDGAQMAAEVQLQSPQNTQGDSLKGAVQRQQDTGIHAIPLMPQSSVSQMPPQAVPMPSPQVPPMPQAAPMTMASSQQVPPTKKKEKADKNMQVPPKQMGGMPVPPSNKPQPIQNNVADNEEKMSWMYLMQHYNKENAAIYKAQKEAKKQSGASNKGNGKNKSVEIPQNNYAIPGMPGASNASGFPIPGQPSAPPQPQATPVAPSQAPIPKPQMPQPQIAPPQAPQMPQGGIPAGAMNPAPMQNAMPPYPSPQPMSGAGMSFGETTVLGGGTAGETTVLSAIQDPAQAAMPYLIRVKTNEKINISKPVFRLGKERSFVDYFIPDNATISRSHANILIKEGAYYIVDTNSTNHTYVNGAMIQSSVETAITHGDKIRLANEEFEFKVY